MWWVAAARRDPHGRRRAAGAHLRSSGPLGWPGFRGELKKRFKALDDEYLDLLREYWNDGQLFDNARMGSEIEDGQRYYFRTPQLNSVGGSVLSWD